MLNETIPQPTIRPHALRRPLTLLLAVGAILLLWVASGLLVPATLGGLSAQLQGFVTIFLGIFIEALPFLLAGVLTSSAIHLFVSDRLIARLSPRSPLLAALTGALLGLAMPVCECGAIPTTRRLLAKGAPAPLGIAFVLAAPVVNPIVIISTWVAFSAQPWIVAARVGLTVLIAVAVALVVGRHPRPHDLLAPVDLSTTLDAHDHSHCPNEGWTRALLGHASTEFFEMGRYLVIGGLLAAALQTLVPRSALLALGQGPLLSTVALMLLAIILSICSTVDAFVALAFVSSFLPGAVLAFLVFGPMIDIKSVLMLTTTFSRRTVALLVLLTFQMALLAGVLINIYM